jgi:hypothetical protein
MAITAIKTYEGTIGTADRKSISFTKEMGEVLEGNRRWQAETGNWKVQITYNVDGIDTVLENVLSIAEIGSLTLDQIVFKADTLLKVQLGLSVDTAEVETTLASSPVALEEIAVKRGLTKEVVIEEKPVVEELPIEEPPVVEEKPIVEEKLPEEPLVVEGELPLG